MVGVNFPAQCLQDLVQQQESLFPGSGLLQNFEKRALQFGIAFPVDTRGGIQRKCGSNLLYELAGYRLTDGLSGDEFRHCF